MERLKTDTTLKHWKRWPMSYTRVGNVSAFSVFGKDVYLRMNDRFSLFGFVGRYGN